MDPMGLMYERSALCVIDDDEKNKDGETNARSSTASAPSAELPAAEVTRCRIPETTDPRTPHLGPEGVTTVRCSTQMFIKAD